MVMIDDLIESALTNILSNVDVPFGAVELGVDVIINVCDDRLMAC